MSTIAGVRRQLWYPVVQQSEAKGGRGVATALASEFLGAVWSPLWLVEINWASTTSRYATAARDVTWDSETWLGNGVLRHIEAITEPLGVVATSIAVGLAGEDSSVVSAALTMQRNKALKVWLGAVDSDGSVISTPAKMFDGLVETGGSWFTSDAAGVEVRATTHLLRHRRARIRRYTSEDQKQAFAGDKGFDYVEGLQSKQVLWGRPG